MNKQNSVCTLVVTYNRKNYLINCIEALINQTTRIDKILIFDNHSNDGTFELLKMKGYIKNKKEDSITRCVFEKTEILYYYSSFNGGGSYGFHTGIQLAKDEKCKYIWTMDDDVLPDKNCLTQLLEALKTRRICIPNRTDQNYQDFAIINLNMTNPFKYNIKKRQNLLNMSKTDQDIVDVVNMPFEGPIFETKIVEEIGLPNKELFIIFDDTEFAYRISKITTISLVKKAILHKQIISKRDRNKLMNWKNYYGLRNQYWFDRKYGKNVFVRFLRPILNHTELIIKALLRRKFSNIEILRAAYYDGTHNILGKTVEPGEKFIYIREEKTNWNKKRIQESN